MLATCARQGVLVDPRHALGELVAGPRISSGPKASASRVETDASLARGVFGAPTFVIGDEIFWGKDRMDFIDQELAQLSADR